MRTNEYRIIDIYGTTFRYKAQSVGEAKDLFVSENNAERFEGFQVEVTTETKHSSGKPFKETYKLYIKDPTQANIVRGIKKTILAFNKEERDRKKQKKDYPMDIRTYGKLISYKVGF